MGRTLANKKGIDSHRRHSIHNNLKCKLAHLIQILDFNKDKPDILDAKIFKFKVDFFDFIGALSKEEAEYLTTNDYYHCIVSRLPE